MDFELGFGGLGFGLSSGLGSGLGLGFGFHPEFWVGSWVMGTGFLTHMFIPIPSLGHGDRFSDQPVYSNSISLSEK